MTIIGDRLYEMLAPLAYDDESQGNAVKVLCDAAGAMFEQVAQLVEPGPNGEPAWSVLLDIDRCPGYALPWLGQFVGVTVDTTLDEAGQRRQIREEAGMKRGTSAAIAAAAQRYLTGTQTVIMVERDSSVAPAHPAYGLKVLTLTAETPDSAAVLAALMAAKPAGIILEHDVVDGQTWQQLIDNYATWGDVISAFGTWQDVIDNTP